jgi:hypothetical protein
MDDLRDPLAPVRPRPAHGPADDDLRARDEAEEADLREWAGSDAAEIPSKTAYGGA